MYENKQINIGLSYIILLNNRNYHVSKLKINMTLCVQIQLHDIYRLAGWVENLSFYESLLFNKSFFLRNIKTRVHKYAVCGLFAAPPCPPSIFS